MDFFFARKLLFRNWEAVQVIDNILANLLKCELGDGEWVGKGVIYSFIIEDQKIGSWEFGPVKSWGNGTESQSIFGSTF